MEKENCIFCKIINKEIPCDKIYEDKKFMAFLDIQPITKGHTLLIPKTHIIWMQEAEDKLIENIFKLTKKIMLAIKKSLKCDYVQVSIVGKDVPHFHIHLIPRYNNDGFKGWPTKKYEKNKANKLAKKLTAML